MKPSYFWGKVSQENASEQQHEQGRDYFFSGFELHVRSDYPSTYIAEKEPYFLFIWGRPKFTLSQDLILEALTNLVRSGIYGTDDLPMLGSFSGVMWNKVEKTLWLFSDPIGIKRIFYATRKDDTFFSSHSGVVARLSGYTKTSSRAMAHLLTIRGIPAPDTFFDGVISLNPAESVEISRNSVKKHKYYPIENELRNKQEISYADAELQLSKIMIANLTSIASGKRMAISLSGGVDSMFLAATAVANGISLIAKTVGFSPVTREDEVDRAVIISDALGIKLEVIRPKDEEFITTYSDSIACFPEPDGDATSVLELTLGLKARDSSDILLDGTGADNIFCSLDKHKAQHVADFVSKIPYGLRANFLEPILERFPSGRQNKFTNLVRKANKILIGIENSGDTELEKEIYWAHTLDPYIALNFFKAEHKFQPGQMPTKVYLTDLFFQAEKVFSSAVRSSFIGVRGTLPARAFKKISTTADLTGVEISLPFMYPDFVKATMTLPDDYKFSGGKTKIILKDLVREIIPQGLKINPKANFSPPIKRWLNGPLLSELLRISRNEPILDSSFIELCANEMIIGKKDWQWELWVIYSALKWKEEVLRYNYEF